jgi:dihydrofolate synthase/folylpolyglutamate synthase
VDAVRIPKRSLSAILALVRDHLDVYGSSRRGYATFFDLLTATAFMHFRRSKVDVAVIETGLGGRLDATNVLRPEVTIITRLSLEHTDKLGDTLEEIAAEKLAICHPGVPCVAAPQTRQILPFMHRWLKERNVPAKFVQSEYVIEAAPPQEDHRSLFVSSTDRQRRLCLRLLGAYQAENAATVCAVVDVLRDRWRGRVPIAEKALRKGLRNTIWPGRFEILREKETGWPTTVVLDVAHTERGAASLRQSLLQVFGRRARVVLLGFLRGKNILGIVGHLVRRGDTLIYTTAPSPRAIPVAELHEMLRRGLHGHKWVQWRDRPEDALALAREVAGTEKLVVVAGSLYLVGRCREILLRASPR